MILDFLTDFRLSDVMLQYTIFYIELMGGTLLFAFCFKKRERSALRLGGSVVGIYGFFMLFIFLMYRVFLTAHEAIEPNFGWIMLFILFMLFFIGLNLFLIIGTSRFCFVMNVWEGLFCGVCGYSIQHIIYRLNVILEFFSLKHHWNKALFLTLLALVAAAVFISSYFLLARRLRGKYSVKVENKRLLLLLGIVMSAMIFLSNLGQAYFKSETFGDDVRLFIECAFAVIICYFTLFMLFDVAKNKDLEEENERVQWLWRADRKQYEASKSNVEQLNIKYHDLKYLLRSIKADSAAAREIEQCLKTYEIFYRTGNETLDVALSEKSALCRAAGITLTCAADGQLLNGMEPSHIYSLFSNALDNAIESLAELEDETLKTIDLTVKKSGAMVMIQIENPVCGQPVFKDGLPLTTKTDSENHGYGLKSMRSVAKLYGGNLSVTIKEDVFSLLILLPESFKRTE